MNFSAVVSVYLVLDDLGLILQDVLIGPLLSITLLNCLQRPY